MFTRHLNNPWASSSINRADFGIVIQHRHLSSFSLITEQLENGEPFLFSISLTREALNPTFRRSGAQRTKLPQRVNKLVRDDGASVIEAGVSNASRGSSHSINPRESTATNTIIRAALAEIASDSYPWAKNKVRSLRLSAKPDFA